MDTIANELTSNPMDYPHLLLPKSKLVKISPSTGERFFILRKSIDSYNPLVTYLNNLIEKESKLAPHVQSHNMFYIPENLGSSSILQGFAQLYSRNLSSLEQRQPWMHQIFNLFVSKKIIRSWHIVKSDIELTAAWNSNLSIWVPQSCIITQNLFMRFFI